MIDSFKKISAVIVTFEPADRIIDNLEIIIKQVNNLIIVDNGSHNKSQELLESFAKDHQKKVTLILNGENLGLSKAQNIGIKQAFIQKSQWVMLLDDDSKPRFNMVAKMRESYQGQPNPDNIAIIAPYVKDTQTNNPPAHIIDDNGIWFKRKNLEQDIFVTVVIASGSLIKSDILQKHGLMYEDFFIDCIDTEFCLRMIANKYKILAVKNAVLNHTLGAKSQHNVAGMSVTTTNHSPKRRFYSYRNRSIIWKYYITKTPKYVVYDILAANYNLLRILLCEQEKLAKITSAVKGLCCGLATKFDTTLIQEINTKGQ